MRGYLRDPAERDPGPRRFLTLDRRRHETSATQITTIRGSATAIPRGTRSGVIDRAAVTQQGINHQSCPGRTGQTSEAVEIIVQDNAGHAARLRSITGNERTPRQNVGALWSPTRRNTPTLATTATFFAYGPTAEAGRQIATHMAMRPRTILPRQGRWYFRRR
jgi:hypothetical protein